MSAHPAIHLNRADLAEIRAHLERCDSSFVPPLSQRVDIHEYAAKLVEKSERFEAWDADELVALIAVYCNDPQKQTAFITSVSVLPSWRGQGIAARILVTCLDQMRQTGFGALQLEVDPLNHAAIALYRKHGFSVERPGESPSRMNIALGRAGQ